MAGLAVRVALAGLLAFPAVATPKDDTVDRSGEVLLGIVLIEEEKLPPLTNRAMQSEIERLFRIPGLRIQWTTLERTFGSPVCFTKLVVVRVRSCEQDARGARVRGCARSLGNTHIVDNCILPFVQIFVRSVEDIIEDVIHSHATERDLWLGRALGRVLAHELYHVLADTKEHGLRGLTQPYFDAKDLIWRSEVFHPHELRRMWERGLAPKKPPGERQ